MITPAIDWASLRNPILAYEQWSIKDACCAWHEGVCGIFFSAFDEERSCVAGVRTSDFRTFSELQLVVDGRATGAIGMCSPNIVEVDQTFYLTCNSWGDSPNHPNQLYYLSSNDLLHWSAPMPLAPEITAGARAIDAALAYTGDAWHLIFKREQQPQPVLARAPRLDGPWRLVGDGRVTLARPDAGWRKVGHENFQFIQIDQRWRLLSTDYPPHRPYLYTISGTGARPEDWLRWEQAYELVVPEESFNTVDRANAAALAGWRDRDGCFYLIYAGTTRERSDAFRGTASQRPWPRGWNRLGLARSRDLRRWWPAGALEGAI